MKIYRGLDLNFSKWAEPNYKNFWHEKADQYTANWKVRTLDEYGEVQHNSSHLSEPIPLGKFKHILLTGNNNFEFRVFEKGILRVLKSETKKRIQQELDREMYPYKFVAEFF